MTCPCPAGFPVQVSEDPGRCALLVGTAPCLAPPAVASRARTLPPPPQPLPRSAGDGGGDHRRPDDYRGRPGVCRRGPRQQELQQVPPEERRAFLVTVLIDMKVMAKAAKAAGMADTDLFKRAPAVSRRALAAPRLLHPEGRRAGDRGTVKAAYDQLVKDFKPVEEVHARHILVATEEEAKAVKAELDGGKPFEVLAMEKTTDPRASRTAATSASFPRA